VELKGNSGKECSGKYTVFLGEKARRKSEPGKKGWRIGARSLLCEKKCG